MGSHFVYSKWDPIECSLCCTLKMFSWPDDDRLTVEICCHNVIWVYTISLCWYIVVYRLNILHYIMLLLHNGMVSVKKKNKRLYMSVWFSPYFILYLFKLMCFPDDSKRILYKICRHLAEISMRSELPPQTNSRNWKRKWKHKFK